jgi:DegV family protein with EDD domain
MRPIKVITDSTSDLPEEIQKQYNVAVIPLYVNFGTQSYRDKADINPTELFRKVKETGKLPMTSSPTVADFTTEFKKYIDEGMDILHISISSKISSSYRNACSAAADFPQDRIMVIDSLSLSTGIGILVLTAADCVRKGSSLADTAQTVRSAIAKVRVEFIIDTVEYLHKGGRCSGLQMLISSLLEIHPIIRVAEGAMYPAAKIRGNRHLVLRRLVQNTLNNLDSINRERIFISHCECGDEADQIKSQFEELKKFDRILITNLSCVITSHCGPKTIGIVYVEN